MNYIHQWDSRSKFAVGIGLGLCAITFFVQVYLASFEHDYGLARGIVEQMRVLVGSFLLGAVPAFMLTRYRLVSPILVALSAYTIALLTSWSSLVESARSAGAGITPTVFDLMASLWFLSLGVALLFGAIEYWIRPASSSRFYPLDN